MKTQTKILFTGLLLALSLLFTSCLSSLGEVIAKPQIKFGSISLNSVDMEGFTFNVDYSINNPYPVSFSIAGVNADVMFGSDSDATKITSLSASEGIKVEGMDTAKNTVSFKIPYKTILSLATKLASSDSEGKAEALPLSFKGNAKLDLSAVPLFEGETLTLPFAKSFNVPIFKPSFSVSAPTLQMPTLDDLKNSLVNGGMSVLKAAKLAANIIAGNKLSEDALDGIDLDMTFRFNLNVKNEGSCSWNYLLNNCSLSSGNNRLAKVNPEGSNSISSQSGTIPVSCTLNTIQAGRYIVELLNKTAKNPVVTVDSKLNFPGISGFMTDIPLDYTKEISVSSITKK